MKYLGLQLGRGLAAMLVVLHHIEGKLEAAQPELPLFMGGLFGFGWVGVDFFFVLSGFIITLTVQSRPQPSDFIKRRIARVHVPFWAAFAATLAVAMALPGTRASLSGFSIAEWALAVALLPSGQSAPVIGVAWTLHHEILFYGTACLWLISPAASAALATALLAGSIIVGAQAAHPAGFLFSPLHWEFLFGVIACLMHTRVSQSTAKLAILLGVLWMAVWGWVQPAPNLTEDPTRVVQHGIAFGLICLGVAAWERTRAVRAMALGRSSSSNWFATIAAAWGDWSYGLYLIHIPIILAVIKLLATTTANHGHAWVQVTGTICFAACMCACWLFHVHIERPLVKRAHRLLARDSRR